MWRCRRQRGPPSRHSCETRPAYQPIVSRALSGVPPLGLNLTARERRRCDAGQCPGLGTDVWAQLALNVTVGLTAWSKDLPAIPWGRPERWRRTGDAADVLPHRFSLTRLDRPPPGRRQGTSLLAACRLPLEVKPACTVRGSVACEPSSRLAPGPQLRSCSTS